MFLMSSITGKTRVPLYYNNELVAYMKGISLNQPFYRVVKSVGVKNLNWRLDDYSSFQSFQYLQPKFKEYTITFEETSHGVVGFLNSKPSNYRGVKGITVLR